jgi:hypothetical protein
MNIEEYEIDASGKLSNSRIWSFRAKRLVELSFKTLEKHDFEWIGW